MIAGCIGKKAYLAVDLQSTCNVLIAWTHALKFSLPVRLLKPFGLRKGDTQSEGWGMSLVSLLLVLSYDREYGGSIGTPRGGSRSAMASSRSIDSLHKFPARSLENSGPMVSGRRKRNVAFWPINDGKHRLY